MKTEITQLLKTKSHNFNGRIINGINARLLHKALDVGRDYSNWIKARIKQGRFIENLDYLIVQNVSNGSPKLASQKGGNNKEINEYILSLDMAKHLCLMEKTEIAHEIRQHFINAEKKLAEIAPKVYRNTLADTQARLEAIDHNKTMTDAIQESLKRNGKREKPHHYSIEQEMIDSIVLGVNVRKWKAEQGILGKVRSYFNAQQLKLLKTLLQTNASLIAIDMPFSERKTQLTHLAQRQLAKMLNVNG